MRTSALAVGLVLICSTVACGEDATEPVDDAAAVVETSEATPPPGDQEAEEAVVLDAVVGEPDDPDAFTITMTDDSGDPVETLEPGTYEIRVSDLSSIHNFHLTGPGVEETTTVPEVVDTTWTVTFEQGEYTFTCDPHPPMEGSFTVA